MTAYWLTFKPRSRASSRGLPIEQLRRLVRFFDRYPTRTAVWWRCVSYESAKKYERVYFFKQGKNGRGIFGIGHVLAVSKSRTAAYDPIYAPRVKVKIEYLVDPTEKFILDYDEVQKITGDNLPNAQASGNIVENSIQKALDDKIDTLCNNSVPGSITGDDFDISQLRDERELSIRSMYVRLGQALFRTKLMRAYKGRCAFSLCDDEAVLEAAHIRPYLGAKTNVTQNGLILRADIHKLFDKNLISIDPITRRILISKRIKYQQYIDLAGVKILTTADLKDRPNVDCLKWVHKKFRKS